MGIAFLGMIGSFNKMMPRRTSMKKLRNDAPTIFLRSHWPSNSSDLNLLDYCLWDELGKTTKWNRVASKKSLIVTLKRAIKEVLCLKVARRRPIDYIGCHKTRKII